MLFSSACCLAFVARASVSKTATPTVTAMSSLVYVTRIRRVQPLSFRTFGSVDFAAEAQFPVSAVGPFLYTVSPMVSWVPGKRTSGLSGALSFFALAMKSIGSSGGGALVGANDGAVPVGLGTAMSEPPGSWEEVPGEASSPPSDETTATATAVPTAMAASAPPPMNSSRRRLARASEASASAAQSGDWPEPPPLQGCWEFGFQGS